MKPIRWRRNRATVEGVLVEQHTVEDAVVIFAGRVFICISLPASSEQIDAAAYALADLVATLRGME